MKSMRVGFVLWLLLVLQTVCQPVCASEAAPIRIGATVSREGLYKEPSMMIMNAFLLWAQRVNQKGGLLGRRVELILYNDKSSPKMAGDLYRKLLEEDQVDFVFSPYSTTLTLEASAVSEQYHRVMLACGASGEVVWQRGLRYVFGLYAVADRYFIGMLDLMARRGYKNVSLVYDKDSPFHVEAADGVRKWAERFKMTIDKDLTFRKGGRDFPRIIRELKENRTKHLLISAYPPDCYRFLALLKENDYRPPVLGATIAPVHPNFGKKAGEMAENVFGATQWEPDERIPFPGTKAFVKSFSAFAGMTPSYHAVSAYSACMLYEKAITATQSFDNEKVRDYIANLDTVTLIGRFKVDATGKQIGHNPMVIQWQKGRKEIVWPTKMQTAIPNL